MNLAEQEVREQRLSADQRPKAQMGRPRGCTTWSSPAVALTLMICR